MRRAQLSMVLATRGRELVRGMIKRVTVARHESGAIEVNVRGAFAGVMQAAGLVETHAPKRKTAPERES